MEDAIAPSVPLAPLAAGAVTPTTLFLTRRRSHLDSGSYRTLSRLFSHCLHLHPQKHAVPAHPESEPAAANPIGGKSPQEGSVPPKDAEFERGKGVPEEPAAVIASVPETPAPSVVEAAAGNPIADLDVAPQGSAEHELAGVERVEGVEDMVVVGSACRKTGAVVEESGGEAELVGADEVLRTMKACLDGEVEESVEVEVVSDEHLLLDRMMTNFSGLIGDASGGATSRQTYGVSEGEPQNDGNISEGVPKLGDGIEEDRPMGDSGHQSVVGEVFEEGEIEGDLQGVGDESDGSERQDADDEKLEGDSVTKGPGENESSVHDIRCLNSLSKPKKKETGDLILNKEGNIKNDALIRVQTVSYEEIVEWNETPVPDAEISRRGNRKQHLTEERKAKKTKNKRVKRAQQRVADGVKRLKLTPIIKPKVVQYCHFYLHGKCQQGNACKFSHDTTPLTKSKPCTHFARGSCLKGEDCPYDHELSKYPCHNFVENGTCFRGDKCKFSHVVSTADGPSKPDAKESDLSLVSEKPISRDQTSSQKALAVHDGRLLTSAPTKHNSILKTLAGISVNAQKASGRMPKGVQFRPSSKDRSDSSMLHQDALPTEKHMYTNAGKYKNFGGPQAVEGDINANPNRQRSVPLFDEKNSLKEASSLAKKSFPADTTAVLGSVSTQHEVSEASRILQEFLFGAGS